MSRALKVGVLALVGASLSAVPAAAARPAYAPHSVIVKFRPGATPQRIGDRFGGDRFGFVKRTGVVRRIAAQVIRVRGDAAAVATRLERSPLVAYAEPNYVVRAAAIPNDPFFPYSYGLNNTGQFGAVPDADIDAPQGWDAAGIGSFPPTGGMKIGLVDTGIEANHEDLSGKVSDCGSARGGGLSALLTILLGGIVEGNCADELGHGTLVAGVVGATANNARGVTGVAFNSPLAICKALGGPVHTGSAADVANCITWAHDRGAKVISMSLVAPASKTLKKAVDYAWEGGAASGSVLVASAGNDANGKLNYPAAFPNVVSVAATDYRDQRARFSNANSDVEIAAPGVNIWSTARGGYAAPSGTSMATPYAAGAAAIIRDRNPGATAAQVVSTLDAATDDLGVPGRDPSFGFGRLNLFKAATG